MSWHYRSPLVFPALFLTSMREAAKAPMEPLAINADKTKPNLEAMAEKFRWFKWCIRQDPGVVRDLYDILETFDVRTQIIKDEIGYILSIYARPTKISEFIRLNPELAAEIVPECQ